MHDNYSKPDLNTKFESEVDPGQSDEVPQSDAELTDIRKGIFIRLSPDAKETLESAKTLLGKGPPGQRTYAGVIEKLLAYYERQAFQVKENILRGIPSSPLKASEDLLARLHRAQHAFETKRFYFAIKTYSSVARGLYGDDSSEELLDVCRFRLAHCWNQLSYTLRAEALDYDAGLKNAEEKSKKLYALAGSALEMALGCLRKMKDQDDGLMVLIKNYNLACCYSLKAQYIVEASLNLEEPPGDLMRDAKKDRKKTEELWLNSVGLIWQKLDTEGAAEKAAEFALDWLKRICPIVETSSDSQPQKKSKTQSESIWVVNEAREDPDFLFLRSAIEWKSKFRVWEKQALDEGASIAVAIEDLLEEQQVP